MNEEKHELTMAVNVGHWHYAFRNHSALFECAHCKKQQRRNTNFLGNRFQLECDGLKFHRVPKRRKGNRTDEQKAIGAYYDRAMNRSDNGTLDYLSDERAFDGEDVEAWQRRSEEQGAE